MELSSKTLEDVIRTNIQLPASPNGKGFYSVLCPVCGDHGKKGNRAGWKLSPVEVGYNCFNCHHTAKYSSEYNNISKSMRETLTAFGVPDEELKALLFSNLGKNNSRNLPQTLSRIKDKNKIPPTIELPKHFYLLSKALHTDKIAELSRYYLEDRCIDISKHRFYLSNLIKSKWYKRIILTSYYNNNLIFYHGRSLVDSPKKYETPMEEKENVLYGFDEINAHTTKPIYVVEGWFDAAVLEGGVAIFGNKMTVGQINWLNSSKREKIVIPDRKGDGHVLATQAVEEGWGVSFPDFGDECKDINDAIVRYGRLYVNMELLKSTFAGFSAIAAIAIYCKK